MASHHKCDNKDAYARALRRALQRRTFLCSTERYLTREEAHDRTRLRFKQDPPAAPQTISR